MEILVGIVGFALGYFRVDNQWKGMDNQIVRWIVLVGIVIAVQWLFGIMGLLIMIIGFVVGYYIKKRR